MDELINAINRLAEAQKESNELIVKQLKLLSESHELNSKQFQLNLDNHSFNIEQAKVAEKQHEDVVGHVKNYIDEKVESVE